MTASGELAREFVLGAARAHGRIPVLNRRVLGGIDRSRLSAATAGPRRADVQAAVKELGGLRAVKHYMQRTAIQGSQPCSRR